MAGGPATSARAAHPRVLIGNFFVLLGLVLTVACGDRRPATPSPPGPGTGETITGRERIGWDQLAANPAELATLRYVMYVDGVRSELADASCAQTATAAGFACSARLPAMSNGVHALEIAAFYESGGIVESARSQPLRVTVAGLTSPGAAPAAPLDHGEVITTAEGVRLGVDLLVSGLEDVADISVALDGRILVAERGGRVRIASGEVIADALGNGADTPEGRLYGSQAGALPQHLRNTSESRGDGGLASLALGPDFARTGHVYALHTTGPSFRLIRYRLVEGRLIERMPLVRDVPASSAAAAALRFGPDGRLYAAFDDGGDRDAAAKLSEWSGKILRLNTDGSTPGDQPAASPVFWSGLRSPAGLDWTPSNGTLWLAERGADNVERIRALTLPPDRPRRAGQAATYVLPQPVGSGSIAFYRGDTIGDFIGNMFIAAREGGYLLKIRFDEQDPLRAVSSEKLLEGRIGQVRSVLTPGDGSLYVASDSAVWRLNPVPHESRR
jgi:glucose/arabinose dehydrogenase